MTALAVTPPIHAPYQGGDPTTAYQDVRHLIEQAILNQPRSLQKRIGPSEIGNPCDHCLAARLAGWQKTEQGIAWFPAVGTAVHNLLADFIITHENQRNAVHTDGIRWLSEQTVSVGHIGNTPITGSVDLFDTHTGTVIDFKVVGEATLREAKKGPSTVYRAQVHLYAHGLAAGGYDTRHVGIWYIPRNAASLDHGVWWTEPYDPTIATEALERANRFHTGLTATRVAGEGAVTDWVSRQKRAEKCMDCPRYRQTYVPTIPTLDEALGHP